MTQVRDVDGRTWVTLGPDPGAVQPQDFAALRRGPLPALPRGARTVEEFERAVARGERPNASSCERPAGLGPRPLGSGR